MKRSLFTTLGIGGAFAAGMLVTTLEKKVADPHAAINQTFGRILQRTENAEQFAGGSSVGGAGDARYSWAFLTKTGAFNRVSLLMTDTNGHTEEIKIVEREPSIEEAMKTAAEAGVFTP